MSAQSRVGSQSKEFSRRGSPWLWIWNTSFWIQNSWPCIFLWHSIDCQDFSTGWYALSFRWMWQKCSMLEEVKATLLEAGVFQLLDQTSALTNDGKLFEAASMHFKKWMTDGWERLWITVAPPGFSSIHVFYEHMMFCHRTSYMDYSVYSMSQQCCTPCSRKCREG